MGGILVDGAVLSWEESDSRSESDPWEGRWPPLIYWVKVVAIVIATFWMMMAIRSVAEIFRFAERRSIPLREVPRRTIDERAQTRNAQGVIAVASTTAITGNLARYSNFGTGGNGLSRT